MGEFDSSRSHSCVFRNMEIMHVAVSGIGETG